MSQKQSGLSLQMAGDQRKLAHASRRDATATKSMSLLGVIFLPPAYLAVRTSPPVLATATQS